jgi:hypothetical protein
MTGLCQMLENPNRKKGIASDDRTVGTMDSLSKKDLAMIRPASRRGGKKNGNGSSSSSMNLSQVLESMNDSGSSFGSSYRDFEPDNQTMDGTVDSREICIVRGGAPRTSKRGGRRRPSQKDATKDGEEEVEGRAQHKRTISLEDL